MPIVEGLRVRNVYNGLEGTATGKHYIHEMLGSLVEIVWDNEYKSYVNPNVLEVAPDGN